MHYSIIGLIFEAIGFAFLAYEIRRGFDFTRMRPFVYGFADILKREHKTLGSDIFRKDVRGPNFENDAFEKVLKYYGLPMRISPARKKEIMHLGWLVFRDVVNGNDEWEKSIERSLLLAEGRLLSKRVIDWSQGVLLFAAGAGMQIWGTISNMN